MSSQNLEERIAVPYAEAIIVNAKSQDLLDEYKKDLSAILSVLSGSQDLKLFLLNPVTSKFIKKKVLKKLFEDQINQFVMNFLLVLVDRRRISFLETIIQKYLQLNYLLESVTIVELYSAVPLDEVQQCNLIDKVKLITKSNQIKLIAHKDPSLIGGFIIKIGSKVIDASLIGNLNKISLHLSTN
uniref:ATP synthase subunit delta, chloroplastic n=1 Tax=Polysiphonia sertularioides TaxID=945028 RepID=A0A1Z1M8R0_9FLOR|nr:ATP synthase CF1 subunit delta [Polysiphonia sertularioides]ARW62477.1 ATP synthase CF1 subunit delta [Polysiphonia sertularioides]